MVKGEKGVTVALQNVALPIPRQGGGGSRWGEEVGQIWQIFILCLPLPPGDVPGGREVEASPGRVSQGEGQREVSL